MSERILERTINSINPTVSTAVLSWSFVLYWAMVSGTSFLFAKILVLMTPLFTAIIKRIIRNIKRNIYNKKKRERIIIRSYIRRYNNDMI